MVYKPVGADENGKFPPRVEAGLAASFGPTTSSLQDFIGRIRTGIQDVSLLLLGDSTTQMTGSWSYGLPARIAALYPTHTVITHGWNGYLDQATVGAWASPVTAATGTGPRTIHIWNGGMPGKSWNYMLDQSRAANLITTPNPDVILFNNGHNESPATTAVPSSWAGNRDRAVVAIERVRNHAPAAQIILMGQNPFVDGAGNTLGYSEHRADIYRRYAAERGYGFIDGTTPFLRDGRPLGTLIDGPHPNATGHLIWLDEIMRHFTSQTNSQTIPIQPPALEQTARQLIVNGDFADFAAPPTLPNWTATNITLQHDASHSETKQYSAKLTKTTPGAASTLRNRVPYPMAMLAGKWVTLAARLYIPTGAPADTGQIQLRNQSVVIASGSLQSDIRDQWFWATVTALIPTTSTVVDVFINLDPNTGADNRTMSVDRVSLVHGRFPRDTVTALGGSPVITTGATIATDTFTRADSTTSLGVADTGQTWTSKAGVFGISANKAYPPGGINPSCSTIDAGTNSHQVSAVMSSMSGAGQYSGVVARYTNESNWYWAGVEVGGGMWLYKKVAGVATNLGTATGFVAGDTLSLLVTGSTVIVKRNGAAVITVTDSALPNGNLAGLRQGAAQSGTRWDDFEVKAV